MSETKQKTILVVGDSLSKGVSLNEEKKRYCFLKKLLCQQSVHRAGRRHYQHR